MKYIPTKIVIRGGVFVVKREYPDESIKRTETQFRTLKEAMEFVERVQHKNYKEQ